MKKRYSFLTFSVCLILPALPVAVMANNHDGEGALVAACEYVVRPGDSLSTISQKTLGTYHRWLEIRALNPEKVGRGNVISVGSRLKLPCEPSLDMAQSAEIKSSDAMEEAESSSTVRTSEGDVIVVVGKEEMAAKEEVMAKAEEMAAEEEMMAKEEAMAKEEEMVAKAEAMAKEEEMVAKAEAMAKEEEMAVASSNPGANADGSIKILHTEPVKILYPEPVWKASPGSRLSRVLARWAEDAEHKLVIRTQDDWVFSVPFEYQGDFRSALEQVVQGFGLTHISPSIVVYSNNVIILN